MDENGHKIRSVTDYEPLIGGEAIERILKKAEALQNPHLACINSTHYGGSVVELLSSFTLLMNGVGIETGWRVIQGSPDFFSITKKCTMPCKGVKSIFQNQTKTSTNA